MRIGVDAGGTFTDFVVLYDDGRLDNFKLRSNPRAPDAVILAGIEQARPAGVADVVHGSTVATNALLERKGARAAFVTTAGFADLLHIARQNRAELYNLTPALRRHLIPRSLCFGIPERIWYDGTVARRPSAAAAKRVLRELRRQGVQSVALCFLHACQNPENELAVAELLGEGLYLSCSSEICPEFREYERSSTTAINAYVGPLMNAYLEKLETACPHRVSIVQSNGGFMTGVEARKHAVRTILSGPAGGVVGALEMARASGCERILGFDMGGTSTDVSLCEGNPRETTEAVIDGFPIRVPMLDIHTVGAGGGSLARADAGGLLRVGPESAGADPGPACYGVGTQPTVTDAHVVLGRITAAQFLGGQMEIDVGRAASAVDSIALALHLSRTAAAEGILRVANANMERAIRAVSVERGYNPRDFALVAFGGCGGLHACEIAGELGIRTVIVPLYAGALSALGMLLADRVRDYAASVLGSADVETRFAELETRALAEMPAARLQRFADIRYHGQSYELTIPWTRTAWQSRFHKEHERTYGYANREKALEMVTIRVRARETVRKPVLRTRWERARGPLERRRIRVSGKWAKVPAYQRNQVPPTRTAGPALVLDYGSTTLIPASWRFRVDRIGNLIMEC